MDLTSKISDIFGCKGSNPLALIIFLFCHFYQPKNPADSCETCFETELLLSKKSKKLSVEGLLAPRTYIVNNSYNI